MATEQYPKHQYVKRAWDSLMQQKAHRESLSLYLLPERPVEADCFGP